MAYIHPAPDTMELEYPDLEPYEANSMPQEEVDAIIRAKRKARDPKACYACHRRKVKCDRKLPCDSCLKRDHPELCSYERPTKKRRIALAGPLPEQNNGNELESLSNGQAGEYTDLSGPGTVTIPKDRWDRINQELQILQNTVKNLRSGPKEEPFDDDTGITEPVSRDESDKEGIHAPSGQMGTMHLGSRSVLAYMIGLGRSNSYQESAKTLLEENILPKLGLDNETATYPFVDLWSTDSSLHDVTGLLKALPDDALIEEFWIAYRDTACTIYPVVPETNVFESTLNFMLHNRARIGGNTSAVDPDRPYGVSIQWLSLLFAVLASGTQSTDRPGKERELTSQVYTCCSYQALRMANFLTHPSLEVIQAFLVIGNVLSYNMNPGVSYIILGMTMRTAFSIGLHVESQSFPPKEQYLRNRTWWALAWQDSHFSVSYDRPSASAFCAPEIPYRPNSTPGNRSYAESMMRIIKLTQEIIRDRQFNPRTTMTWCTIQSYRDEIARIVADSAVHHRERAACKVTTQHLERLALKLHCSYMTSELCRPALKETSSADSTPADGHRNSGSTPASSPNRSRRKSSHSSETPTLLRRDCIVNLEATIAAYVELFGYSKFAARSWIGIQRAVSAAFLLGTLHDTNRDPRIHMLLQNLEQVISQRTREDPAFNDGAVVNISPAIAGSHALNGLGSKPTAPGEAPHWANSMTKSLKALSKLNATLAGPTRSTGQTSLPQVVQSYSAAPGTSYGGSSGIGGILMPGSVNSPTAGLYGAPPGFSPGGAQGFPITPDSTGSSGDWNYGNLGERVAEFVQPALWG